ncbi:speckle-type POZ protein-like [Planococcus citri]|uniref:speckle-type POZ protein-like n=1 Tax=Planococcus citri TaxID=170843 RepID=UPI0031FA3D27
MRAINTQIIFVIFTIFFTFIKNEPSSEANIECGTTEIQCDTCVRLHKIRYIWNINNLDYHRPEGGDKVSIISPTFSATTKDEVKWFLELLPGNSSTDSISLQICLSPESKETRVRAKFSAVFLDDEQRVLSTYGDDTIYAFDNLGEYWGWDDIPIDAVILPDDKLKIVCNLTFCEYINHLVHRNNASNNLTTGISQQSHCDLCQDFISLLNNSEFSDVVLLTKNKEYPAHKAILAARSPVFATMFKKGQESGKKIKRVDITDLRDEKTVDEMLRYIYTGKCENIRELADDLLTAANKYGLSGLEKMCMKTLCKNLTIENAANMLLLADKHHANELKPKIIRFIAEKYVQVSNTTDWKHIARTKPEYIHEVCQLLLDNDDKH